MQQTINLLDHLEKRESIVVSSQHIASAAILTMAIVLLVSIVTLYNGGQDAALVRQAEENDKHLQAQISSLRIDSTDDSKALQQTKRLLKQRRQILQSLSNQQHDIGEGFSDHLAGLGRQQLKGLWLRSISLRDGGKEISLKGAMEDATLLPRYLQKLGKEPAFSGLRFQLMKIENSEASHHQMQFEISVAAKSDDAGHEV